MLASWLLTPQLPQSKQTRLIAVTLISAMTKKDCVADKKIVRVRIHLSLSAEYKIVICLVEIAVVHIHFVLKSRLVRVFRTNVKKISVATVT